MKNQQARDIFRNYLKNGKNRITPERFEVLESALEYEGHFGADDLYILMKNKKSRVSRATVYNTLELLSQCDLLSKRNFGDNLTRYEINYKKQTHDHLICVDCGRIVEFTETIMKKLPEEICDSLGFNFESYSFNIFGRCKEPRTCKAGSSKENKINK
ncbi:MAG: transcriptional repressor [Ignavibacteriaceae bacterium]|nr:transcriptional repressor [Ignavibacteriaceae bacterium]